MSARLGIQSLVFLGIAACAPPDWVGDVPPQAGSPTADPSSTNEATANETATAPSSKPASPGSSDGTAPAPTGSTSTAPPATVTSCCGGKGTCVATKSVPEDRRDDLQQKECAASQLCAPNENLAPDFAPQRCTGELVVGDYDGVCLSNCVSFDFVAELATVQGSCDSDHRCIPCRTTFGIPTGAPGCE